MPPAARFLLLSLLVTLLPGFPILAQPDDEILHQIEQLTEQLTDRPDEPALLLRRGRLFMEHEAYLEAIADFDRALAQAPDHADTLLWRGLALHRLGASRLALEDLNRYLVSGPPNAMAYEVRAQIRESLGDPAGAVEDLTIAIAVKPRPEQVVRRSRLLKKSGDLKRAIASYEDGIERLGPAVSLVRGLIELETEARDFEEALRWVDLMEARAQRKERWGLCRAQILAKAGRLQDARATYQEVLETLEARLAAGRVTQLILLEKVQALAGLGRRSDARRLLFSLDPSVHQLEDYQTLERELMKNR